MNSRKIKVETNSIYHRDNMPSTGQPSAPNTSSSSQTMSMASQSQEQPAATSRQQQSSKRATRPTNAQIIRWYMQHLKVGNEIRQTKIENFGNRLWGANRKITQLRHIISGLNEFIGAGDLNHFKNEHPEHSSELSDSMIQDNMPPTGPIRAKKPRRNEVIRLYKKLERESQDEVLKSKDEILEAEKEAEKSKDELSKYELKLEKTDRKITQLRRIIGGLKEYIEAGDLNYFKSEHPELSSEL